GGFPPGWPTHAPALQAACVLEPNAPPPSAQAQPVSGPRNHWRRKLHRGSYFFQFLHFPTGGLVKENRNCGDLVEAIHFGNALLASTDGLAANRVALRRQNQLVVKFDINAVELRMQRPLRLRTAQRLGARAVVVQLPPVLNRGRRKAVNQALIMG